MPVAVPAYSSPRRVGSSRIARVNSSAGSPSTIVSHVLPQSVVL